MIGQTLLHFEITAKLGEGGMGEVWRAEDTKLKREVALKMLPPQLAGSQERLERFQREAEILATLDHPNIVTIYSVEPLPVENLRVELIERHAFAPELADRLIEGLTKASPQGV